MPSATALRETVCFCLCDCKVSQYLGAGKATFVCDSCTCRLNRFDTIRRKYEAVKEDLEVQEREILLCMQILLHSLGSAGNQRFRHCPRSLVFPRSVRILSANRCQICVQTASFSMELSDWLVQSHDTLCGCGCS